jgi:hypothetical protein
MTAHRFSIDRHSGGQPPHPRDIFSKMKGAV